MASWLTYAFQRVKLAIYYTLTYPSARHNIRFFRFGIPLMMKHEHRAQSTEADALGFLNATRLNLPIPHLFDTVRLEKETYTVMTRIRGTSLEKCISKKELSDDELRAIVGEIMDVLRRLWTIEQRPEDKGKVMLSASGHGLPDPMDDWDSLWGPCSSIAECYAWYSSTKAPAGEVFWSAERMQATFPDGVPIVTADRVVWVTGVSVLPDNILIENKHLSGLLEWGDSGWLPCHFQIEPLRSSRLGYQKELLRLWKEKRFPEEAERAYEVKPQLINLPMV